MRFLVHAIDRLLRRRLGIYEYTDDPRCIVRARAMRAERPLPVPDGEVPAGAKILELHFWNERLPPLPENGADVRWGVRAYHMAVVSYRLLADHLRARPELAEVEALGGVTVLFTARGENRVKGIFPRLGFKATPCPPPALGRFGQLWENFHTWMIMWAYNAVTLRQRRFLKLERSQFWMRKEDFLRRYGGEEDSA